MLGYVPRAEIEAELAKRAELANDALACNDEWLETCNRLLRLAENLRVDTRRLFQKGFDAGAPQSCPTHCDHEGDINLSCICSPLLPQCAYRACERGLQITEHKIE
jgi:hypothetical protein